jgi:RNA-directed DNA polymerase
MRTKLKEIKDALQRRRHQPIPVQGKWLGQVVSGYFNYHAVPTNSRALTLFWVEITKRWRQSLNRRSQRGKLTWARMWKLATSRRKIERPWSLRRIG